MSNCTLKEAISLTYGLACLSLAGCAVTHIPSASVALFAQGTTVTYDPYLRTTSIVGPHIYVYPVTYFLAQINGQDCILATYYASDWAFLHAAYDVNGNQLSFVKLGSQVLDGLVQERLAINLSSSYLRDHFLEPIRIRLVGDNNSLDISMNSMYIQGFLSKAESQ